MNEKLNPLKRLLAETPPFFIKVQIISIIVLAIAAELAKLDVISPELFTIITSAGAGITLISQFAKKDVQILTEAIDHPGTLVGNLPELLDQVKQIHSVVTSPASVTNSLKAVTDAKKTLQDIVRDAKVVPMAPPAADQPDPNK